ncbi:diaminopimelate epimerase [Corynebacterium pelargi]|uniref:Diaminopimelate epimerase n=1 Tax=Corynebacterium pelargi TaxID=1471400 RepID=A0A410W8D3_9CORY|nr:diaminopimelate epimerase [Corynebacterium pelargi]QAU52208.1 Diaminopimelate epimerase [Corynebacterium pelargi]GGG69356.1 diaminopimelate epimerase [Corynebacterium pelargi]
MTHSSLPETLPFAKGHGTQNDFVILDDPDASLPLSAASVAALCDRRAGIGGDGLLRVARAGALLRAGVIDHLDEGIEESTMFMDYYNADGSTAEMCGNGTRVFAHWVALQGYEQSKEFSVGTRAGAKQVVVHEYSETSADVSVEMGFAEVTGLSTCTVGSQHFAGLGIDVGNPHLACVIPGLDAQTLADLELSQPTIDPEFFPHGVNLEILTPLDQGRTHMRVFERGVGETRSCGTGTVAAARSALADAGAVDGEVTVVVPGGEVHVVLEGQRSVLRGPSALVATGTIQTASLES